MKHLIRLCLLQLYLYFAPLMIFNVSDNLSMNELSEFGLLPVEENIVQREPSPPLEEVTETHF